MPCGILRTQGPTICLEVYQRCADGRSRSLQDYAAPEVRPRFDERLARQLRPKLRTQADCLRAKKIVRRALAHVYELEEWDPELVISGSGLPRTGRRNGCWRRPSPRQRPGLDGKICAEMFAVDALNFPSRKCLRQTG
jgi:hypothetical protein